MAREQKKDDTSVPLFVIRHSIRLLALQLFLVHMLHTILFVGVVLVIFVYAGPFRAIALGIGAILAIGTTGLLSIATIVSIIAWRSDYYVIDKNGLTHYWGIWNKHDKTHTAERVEDIALHQSWVGKILDYGTLVLGGSFMGKATIKLANISRPHLCKQYLQTILLRPIKSKKSVDNVLFQQEEPTTEPLPGLQIQNQE